jgi:hypothetical protein
MANSSLSLDNVHHPWYDYFLRGRRAGRDWNNEADILNRVILKKPLPVQSYPSFIEGYIRASGMPIQQMAFERRRVHNFLAGKPVWRIAG